MTRVLVVVTRMYEVRGRRDDEFTHAYDLPCSSNWALWAAPDASNLDTADLVVALHGDDVAFRDVARGAQATCDYLRELQQWAQNVETASAARTQKAQLNQVLNSEQTEWGILFHPHTRWGNNAKIPEDMQSFRTASDDYSRYKQEVCRLLFDTAPPEMNRSSGTLKFFRSYHSIETLRLVRLVNMCEKLADSPGSPFRPGEKSSGAEAAAWYRDYPLRAHPFHEVWTQWLQTPGASSAASVSRGRPSAQSYATVASLSQAGMALQVSARPATHAAVLRRAFRRHP